MFSDNLVWCTRANFRVLLVVVGLVALAAINALVVPLRLEHQILVHPRTAMLLSVAKTLPEEGQELGIMEGDMSMQHEYLRVLNCLDGCHRQPDMKIILYVLSPGLLHLCTACMLDFRSLIENMYA